MKNPRLLGHLINNFSSHPENLATEALCFILNKSSVARNAFVRFVSQTGMKFPDTISFQSQKAQEDNVIPDLVGLDSDGNQVLVIEAKFWASLTLNQPVNYLKRLPSFNDGILLFVAPFKRFPSLWPELLRRCKKSDISLSKINNDLKHLYYANINNSHVIGLASWTAILNFVLESLKTEGELLTCGDVEQLLDLCEYMNESAFLPVRSEEISSSIGSRIKQFNRLVDEISENLISQENFVITKGMTVSGSSGWYGKYMKIHDFGCQLRFDAKWWGMYRETPLWLNVKDPDFKNSIEAKRLLQKLELEVPSRLIEDREGLLIPLYIPLMVEKQEIIDAVIDQIKEIASYLENKKERES